MRGKCAGSARKVREGARFFMGKRDRNISLKSLPSRLDREAQKKTKKQLAQNKWEPWGRQEERVQGEGLKISGTRECYIAAMNTAVRAGALPGTRGFVRLQESVADAGNDRASVLGGGGWRISISEKAYAKRKQA